MELDCNGIAIETVYRTVILRDEATSDRSRRNGRKCQSSGCHVLSTIVYAIIAFAQFLSECRQVAREAASKDELAEVDHTRILRVLDAVVALSSEAEAGPPVSNRDHDRYLYGKD
jgi:hypothetical protein